MEDVSPLLARVLSGEGSAWEQLQERCQPTLLAIARGHQELKRRGLATSADDIAEVCTATFERLAAGNFKNLRRYCERAASGQASFESWLYGAVDFAIREHLRRRFGRAPRETSRDQVRPSKRDLGSHAGRIDSAEELDRDWFQTLQMTAKLTAAQIFEFAREQFTASELSALKLYYYEQRSYAELAEQLGVDAEEAERMIRRLTARLRYRFADEGKADDERPRSRERT